MPAPLLTIETSPALPASGEAVVIGGGGIVGACTAYWLSCEGVPVVLIENGRVGAVPSSRLSRPRASRSGTGSHGSSGPP